MGTDYAADSSFTIAFWLTKERCTDSGVRPPPLLSLLAPAPAPAPALAMTTP
jgi:hypothetical protein